VFPAQPRSPCFILAGGRQPAPTTRLFELDQHAIVGTKLRLDGSKPSRKAFSPEAGTPPDLLEAQPIVF